MGYTIQKSGHTYRILWQLGKRERRNVPKDSREAAELGFRPDMTATEAKKRAQQLSSERWAELHAKRAATTAAILQKYKKMRGAFLTDDDAEEFERAYLTEKNIARPHWNTMQRIIVDCATHPSQWYRLSSVIYSQFMKHRYSPAYCKKLLRYLNMWGYFICERQGKAWKDIETPPSKWARKIRDAFEKRIGCSGFRSLPLTPEKLAEAKSKMIPEHYKWLFISLWFGLRPREVDNLRKASVGVWRIDTTDSRFVAVLCIFQEKLYERGIQREDCWKYIPCCEPEQSEALKIIQAGEFKAPLNTRMKAVIGERYTRYAGRQGFHELMRRGRGYDLEDVSKWLGHLTTATTQRSYPEIPKASFRRKAG